MNLRKREKPIYVDLTSDVEDDLSEYDEMREPPNKFSKMTAEDEERNRNILYKSDSTVSSSLGSQTDNSSSLSSATNSASVSTPAIASTSGHGDHYKAPDSPVASCSGSAKVKEPPPDEDFDEALACVVCQDIMHDCVGLQPCMHSFCAGCYSEWMATSPNCPTCRKTVERVNRNHLVNNLIEAYLKKNPEKRRAQKELDELDRKNRFDKNGNMVTGVSTVTTNPPAASSTTIQTIPINYNAKVNQTSLDCRQCPGAMGRGVQNFTCSLTTHHISCSQCYTRMPERSWDRVSDPNIPPQKCSGCQAVSCHLYYNGCQSTGAIKKFAKLKDIKAEKAWLDSVLLDNHVESDRFKDYLKRKRITMPKLFNSCVKNYIAGNRKNYTADSFTCRPCAMEVFKDMAYRYRAAIPPNQFSDVVLPDCYWGKECRTQKHKVEHAMKYNHICEQTRFH